jgi:tripartite-type tricarboxylate transporter receptor subunit TctC
MMKLMLVKLACAAVALGASFCALAAESYPARPIRILVPFPAGGAGDLIARTLGEQLTSQMGQPVVVDNRPGAGGRLGTEILAKAEPDGYTLLVGTVGAMAISPVLYKKLPYDPQRDLLPITRIAEVINVMVVNPSTGARTVKEFLDWAKKRPGDVKFGSSGTGQPDHLAAEFFQRLSGVRMTHVPYKGGGPALIDLISGDLQVMFATYVVAQPHAASGRLRVLAVTTPQRQPILPDLPAISEAIPGFGVSNWNAMIAPGKTPARIADRIFSELQKALQAPELRKRQQAAGIDPVGSASREEFIRFVRDDTARWRKIVSEAAIKVE